MCQVFYILAQELGGGVSDCGHIGHVCKCLNHYLLSVRIISCTSIGIIFNIRKTNSRVVNEKLNK